MEYENLIVVKVYFRQEDFADVVKEAEAAGIRPLGLKLEVLKPHGFEGQTIPNTKGIAKMLKYTFQNWKDTKAERAARLAELALQRKTLDAEVKKLGQTSP